MWQCMTAAIAHGEPAPCMSATMYNNFQAIVACKFDNGNDIVVICNIYNNIWGAVRFYRITPMAVFTAANEESVCVTIVPLRLLRKISQFIVVSFALFSSNTGRIVLVIGNKLRVANFTGILR